MWTTPIFSLHTFKKYKYSIFKNHKEWMSFEPNETLSIRVVVPALRTPICSSQIRSEQGAVYMSAFPLHFSEWAHFKLKSIVKLV